jgi:hypothetical protein
MARPPPGADKSGYEDGPSRTGFQENSVPLAIIQHAFGGRAFASRGKPSFVNPELDDGGKNP